ncbi:MAG: MBL fold metallo-hydrolase [Rhizobium sp.]|nr:MBL fold metallo-hydrolase [Rhizobium sp.]
MSLAETMRIHEPYPGLFAYYDGRILGKRLHSDKPNWLDDGAYSLGVASYAIVSGREALVYDTHISFDHARAIRSHLSGLGVTSIRVVLSHWHTDHVAGNAGFIDCPILSNTLTRNTLIEKRKVLVGEGSANQPCGHADGDLRGRDGASGRRHHRDADAVRHSQRRWDHSAAAASRRAAGRRHAGRQCHLYLGAREYRAAHRRTRPAGEARLRHASCPIMATSR